MFGRSNVKDDLESGRQPLYPMMVESQELRWSFIRKVYSILSVQLLITVAVAASLIKVHLISHFFTETKAGLILYLLLMFTPLILLIPLRSYYRSHPLNYVLLGLFTVSLALSVGLSCSYTSGKAILQAFILTGVLVVSLTLYTFWAAKRGHDFNFLEPFLFGSLTILTLFAIIQIYFPLGSTGTMIYGCAGSILFCGYLVYYTDNLIKRFGYDEYIWASIVCITSQQVHRIILKQGCAGFLICWISLFLSLLTAFKSAGS